MVCIENRSSGCAYILFKTGSSKKVAIQHSYVCRMIIKAKIVFLYFLTLLITGRGRVHLDAQSSSCPCGAVARFGLSLTSWPFTPFPAPIPRGAPPAKHPACASCCVPELGCCYRVFCSSKGRSQPWDSIPAAETDPACGAAGPAQLLASSGRARRQHRLGPRPPCLACGLLEASECWCCLGRTIPDGARLSPSSPSSPSSRSSPGNATQGLRPLHLLRAPQAARSPRHAACH